MNLDEIRQSRGYRVLVGTGLVSYGVVHLVLAWIAVQVALGDESDASSAGALRQLARTPLGGVLLWIIAIGFFALTVWQATSAVIGIGGSDNWRRIRKRISSVGRAVVYLGLGILAIRIVLGGKAESGKSEETITARLLGLPAGPLLVGILAAIVIAVGISQVVKGVRQKFVEDLAENVHVAVRRLGTVGWIAKGVSIILIGVLFGWAAVTFDPKKAGGTDQALAALRDQPFGPALLVVFALGIASFGLYCLAWARAPRI